jgi:hypothetical protein
LSSNGFSNECHRREAQVDIVKNNATSMSFHEIISNFSSRKKEEGEENMFPETYRLINYTLLIPGFN